MSCDRPGLFQAVDQFYGTVMLNEESRGDFPDSRFHTLWKSVDRKQELMLLCLNAVFPGSRLAEVEESSDLSSELRQIAVLIGG